MEFPDFPVYRTWSDSKGPLPPAQPGASWVCIEVMPPYYQEVPSLTRNKNSIDIEYENFCKEMWEKYPAKRNHFPGWELNCLKEQTPEFCLAAVKRDWLAIRFVKNKTPDVCIEAIKQKADAINFIDNPHPDLVQFADKVKKHRLAGYVL